jgi:LacI family transcriptional regulator
VSTAIGRLEGYKEAMAAYQMVPLPGHIVSVGTSGDHRGENGGYEAARKLISNKKRPDAIFCFNDPLALGAMRAIFEAGLRIPEDIAVVGCGNLFYNDLLRVPLSSVDQGSRSIGKTAGAMALKLAHNHIATRPKSELIRPHVVARASSLRHLPASGTDWKKVPSRKRS